MPAPSLSLQSVPLTKPDGSLLTPEITLTFGASRTGLVGQNGAGKSTLLRLLSGAAPALGHIDRQASTGMLAQAWDDLSLTVREATGLGAALARLARIERGAPLEDDIDLADWEAPARLAEALARVGLSAVEGTPLSQLSGGQRTRVGLARLLLDTPDILLMDEPTNNLDRAGKALVSRLLAEWPGGAVVASHDRALLAQMDRIVELTPTGIHLTEGGWLAHAKARAARRTRAATELERATRAEARIQRDIQAQREKKAQRDARGRAARASGGQPKVLLDAKADRAGRTSGSDARRAARLEAAGEAARAVAAAHVSPNRSLRIEAEAGRGGAVVLSLEAVTLRRAGFLLGPLTFSLSAGERVALTGPNGAGKSTLMAALRGQISPASGQLATTPQLAALDQQIGDLDPNASILENLHRLAPHLTPQEAQALLARYGFRNTAANAPVGQLSGGERLRAGLAATLGGTPPALLLLDEPTNHLDIETVELLETALQSFTGALLVASHDEAFCAALGLTREIAL